MAVGACQRLLCRTVVASAEELESRALRTRWQVRAQRRHIVCLLMSISPTSAPLRSWLSFTGVAYTSHGLGQSSSPSGFARNRLQQLPVRSLQMAGLAPRHSQKEHSQRERWIRLSRSCMSSATVGCESFGLAEAWAAGSCLAHMKH